MLLSELRDIDKIVAHRLVLGRESFLGVGDAVVMLTASAKRKTVDPLKGRCAMGLL